MVNATLGMDQNKDMGAVNVDMTPIAGTNWWPFILAAMLTGFVGLLLIILVKRRK
jgi:LPXTG-motif cell wall-anchored protein